MGLYEELLHLPGHQYLIEDNGKEESRESMVCLPDCKRMLCKSVIEFVTRAFRFMFPFLRVPWDLDLRVRVEYTENISIEGSLEILPDWYILSFKPKGNGVCKFLIHLSSAINLAFDLKLLVACASYETCSTGWIVIKSVSWLFYYYGYYK